MKAQEEEIEAAAWVPLEHYTEQDTFQAELYQQVCEQRVHRRYLPGTIKQADALISI